MTIDTNSLKLAHKLRKEQTDPEKLLWSKLRGRQLDGYKFRRQQTIGPYIADFFCYEEKLVIEIDGGQHNDEKGKGKDQMRTKWLEKHGYTVIRFWNNEVSGNLEGVLSFIHLTLTLSSKEREQERQ